MNFGTQITQMLCNADSRRFEKYFLENRTKANLFKSLFLNLRKSALHSIYVVCVP